MSFLALFDGVLLLCTRCTSLAVLLGMVLRVQSAGVKPKPAE